MSFSKSHQYARRKKQDKILDISHQKVVIQRCEGKHPQYDKLHYNDELNDMLNRTKDYTNVASQIFCAMKTGDIDNLINDSDDVTKDKIKKFCKIMIKDCNSTKTKRFFSNLLKKV